MDNNIPITKDEFLQLFIKAMHYDMLINELFKHCALDYTKTDLQLFSHDSKITTLLRLFEPEQYYSLLSANIEMEGKNEQLN